MNYKTHKVFSVFFIMMGVMFLYYKIQPEINYYLFLMVGLSASQKGALFPDIDHHWNSVADKTMINRVINFLIRVTGGVHRSRHTHSIDLHILFGALFYYVPNYLLSNGYITEVNYAIASVLLFSFWLGVGSHLFADMLTRSGVYLSCLLNIKIRLIPNKPFFSTGGSWEDVVYSIIKALNILTGLVAIVFPFIINYIS